MSAGYWMLVFLVVIAALLLGFFAGRRSAPAQQRLEALEKERDEARAEAERVQGEVARHFEQSARMFGRLADDYRSFFEHFARTAQSLGLSEGRARELLQRADPRLVADQSGRTTAADGGTADSPPNVTDSGAVTDAGSGGHGLAVADEEEQPGTDERGTVEARDRRD